MQPAAAAPLPRQRWAITLVQPPGYQHAEALREVAEALLHAFRELGYEPVLTASLNLPGYRHLIIGWHLLPYVSERPAMDAVLYNLEQVDAQSSWLAPAALDLARRYELWDYSRRNAEAWRSYGVTVRHCLAIGYVSALSRIDPAPLRDIDVLFYGSFNERREQVLLALRQKGAIVHQVFGVYGEARDALIARSRLVINIHYYEAKVLEEVRLSYLLANRCAVVTEAGCDPDTDAVYAKGCRVARYDELIPATLALLADEPALQRYRDAGLQLMRNLPLAPALANALHSLAERETAAPLSMAALFGAPGQVPGRGS